MKRKMATIVCFLGILKIPVKAILIPDLTLHYKSCWENFDREKLGSMFWGANKDVYTDEFEDKRLTA